MIVVHGETLWSPAPQPMDDDECLPVFKLTYFGSTFFCIIVKKCQKFYKLNEFYSVTEVTLNKGNFIKTRVNTLTITLLTDLMKG